MPFAIEDPTNDATPVHVHRWKSQVRDFEDKTKAFSGFNAKVFLKVEGQCTEAMKGRAIRRRDYDATHTKKDGNALLKIVAGISIEIEGRRHSVVLNTNAMDQYINIKVRQSSMRF